MGLAKPRSAEELLIDRFLLLYTVKQSEKLGWLGAIKTQKIVFYSEYLMNQKNERGFNLLFRRYKWGPYSDNLKEDIKDLSSVNLIEYEKDSIRIGDLGERILKDTMELIDSNRWVIEAIKESSHKIAPLSTNETLDFIYKLPVKTRYGNTVEDVPDGGTIIKPLIESDVKITLNEDWIETLDILMNPGSAVRLYQMLDSTSTTRILPFVVD